MKKMTASEANRNFTVLTNMVDEEEIVSITKRGKARYIIMTVERYEGREKFEDEMKRKTDAGLWVKTKKGEFRRIKTSEGKAQIVTISKIDGKTVYWRVIDLSAKDISFEESAPLKITVKDNIINFRGVDALYEEVASSDDVMTIRLAEKEIANEKEIPEAIFKGSTILK